MADAPKVFISHASEDKDRFVLKFGELLRSKGVDAWVDKWEMRPGDSLVDKIFEEGLKNARAVLVVVSRHSIAKPWFREELNAAMVRKINGHTKLIPVVIDECEVPECLKSTVWERISNLETYEEGLNRIVQAIFEVAEKPPLGHPPKYTEAGTFKVSGLKPIDTIVFTALCRACIEKDNDSIDAHDLAVIPQRLELDEELFCESLQILKSQSFAELGQIDGGTIWMAKPTVFGFHQFLMGTRKDYAKMVSSVAVLIINEKQFEGRALAAAAKIHDPSLKEIIVNFIVLLFEGKGWVRAARYNGFTPCSFIVTEVTPQFTRWLRDNNIS